MVETLYPEPRLRRRSYSRGSGSDCGNPAAGLAAPTGGRARKSAAASRTTVRQPARGGLGRWMLDMLLVGFAHGGCIHHTHPAYIDFLRDLSGTRQGQG